MDVVARDNGLKLWEMMDLLLVMVNPTFLKGTGGRDFISVKGGAVRGRMEG